MSISTKSPLRTVGGNLYSGSPQTGEFLHIRGGAVTVSVFSGGILSPGSGSVVPVTKTGDQAVFWSGAGRLNSAFIHQSVLALSGFPIYFYDSAVPGASGPVNPAPAIVGCDLLGVVNIAGGGSGAFNVPTIVNFDTAFQSGLAVGIASGCPGVTFTFTPEVIPVFF